jgi:hypothetical protein
MTVESLTSIRELSNRLTNGLQVRLLWCQADGRLWVTVINTRTGEAFRVDVRETERPLDVFDHPYAYAAHHRIDTQAGQVEPGPAISARATRRAANR